MGLQPDRKRLYMLGVWATEGEGVQTGDNVSKGRERGPIVATVITTANAYWVPALCQALDQIFHIYFPISLL